ncbi:hypothetical protein H6P81_003425 [Aristolochia fimbriata]|uniref:Homeobox domain-containing protein n=1 Tax=Aristolochia fimbriata TaxID=158543 RepID=A0AAV7FCI4_ARIFI|nr:hypothetical protein H6P81_003425 [Aristolochia fimbriata]
MFLIQKSNGLAESLQERIMPCASASSSLACRSFASAPCLYQLGNYPNASLRLGCRNNSLLLPRRPLVVAFARRKNASTSPKEKKRIKQDNDREEDGLDEDAFEALFKQLEEDLKNDDVSADDWNDELTEEDLVRLEQELEEALGSEDEGELRGILQSLDGNLEANVDEEEEDNEVEEQQEPKDDDDDDDDDDEQEEPVKLKTWQLRRLASALKIGRRKTSIKNLAAELGLDRGLVLELLRDPPPNLLLMSATLPEVTENHVKQGKSLALKTPMEPVEPAEAEDVAEPKLEVKAPIHVMVNRWSTQKRLKKVQIETLERVYLRTKRPTNSMINSVVHVTNLPRKTVIKWFEEKRLQDGGPDQRLPYTRSVAEVVPQTNN